MIAKVLIFYQNAKRTPPFIFDFLVNYQFINIKKVTKC